MKFMILLLLTLLTLLPVLNFAETKNTIFLHDGKVTLKVPSDWVIIQHIPKGIKTLIAFQLMNNPAEAGTQDSTNLAITTFDLRDAKMTMNFVGELIKKLKKGEKQSEYKDWAIRQWSATQGKTKYIIYDARFTLEKSSAGIHVRIAWPELDKNPKDYNKIMKTTLENILMEILMLNKQTLKK